MYALQKHTKETNLKYLDKRSEHPDLSNVYSIVQKVTCIHSIILQYHLKSLNDNELFLTEIMRSVKQI